MTCNVNNAFLSFILVYFIEVKVTIKPSSFFYYFTLMNFNNFAWFRQAVFEKNPDPSCTEINFEDHPVHVIMVNKKCTSYLDHLLASACNIYSKLQNYISL